MTSLPYKQPYHSVIVQSQIICENKTTQPQTVVWNIITEENVSFALYFFFHGTISQMQWHWTIISHWHQMQARNTAFTGIDTTVQINLYSKKVGHMQSKATSPDTFGIPEIQSLLLEKLTCHKFGKGREWKTKGRGWGKSLDQQTQCCIQALTFIKCRQ